MTTQQQVTNFPTHNSILRQSKEPVICQYYYQHHRKELESNDLNKSFLSKKSSNSAALENDTQPAIRNLRIYHPPRRKKKVMPKVTHSSKSSLVKKEDHNKEKLRNRVSDPGPQDKNTKLSFSAGDHSYSEESSEDSAYNEGECVLSSDSRGSTPENSTIKRQLAEKSSAIKQNTPNQSKRIVSSSNGSQDEIKYLRFLKEITNDILKKNIFTNKALRCVFQHHIEMNKYSLDEDKMVAEVAKLQERLGVPNDEKLDDEDYGLGKDISDEEAENTTTEMRSEDVTVPSASSSVDALRESKSENQNENPDGEKLDGLDDNYSDSFSDMSPSEQGETEGEEDKIDSEEIPLSSHEEANDDEGSDDESSAVVEKNYDKTASQSDVNSDSEISEIC